MSAFDLFDNLEVKPVTCTWVIDEFLDRMRYIGSSKMGSPVTKLSSGAFNLYLTRKGDNNVEISFAARGYVPEFYYRISLIDDKGQEWRPQNGRADSFQYRIWCDYFRYEEYGLLPDGKLTVYCEIFELNDPAIQCRLKCVNLAIRDFHSKKNCGKLSDVVLVVGGREFKAHKLILSSRSVVFEKMFEHDMEESKRNRVEITDMSAAAVEDMLKFIYAGSTLAKCYKVLKHPVPLYELLYAADKYQIDLLKSYCEFYLEFILTSTTLPMILRIAEMHSLKNLKSKCFNYITHHSTKFDLKEWEMLTTLNPDAICQMLVWKYSQEK